MKKNSILIVALTMIAVLFGCRSNQSLASPKPFFYDLIVYGSGDTYWRPCDDRVRNIHVVKRITMPFSTHIQDVIIKGTIQAKRGDQFRQVLLDIAQRFNGNTSIPCEIEISFKE